MEVDEDENNAKNKLSKLVESTRTYYSESDAYGSEYVAEFVAPALREYLHHLHLKAVSRHKHDESGSSVNVIHYTSIETLISLLSSDPNYLPSDEEHDHPSNFSSQNNAETNSSVDSKSAGAHRGCSPLRLYDSVYLNDPNESVYFFQKFEVLKQYDLNIDREDESESRAYMTSFISANSSDQDKSPDDNLIFWRTYGKEGEGCSLSILVPTNQLRKVLYGPKEVEATAEIFVEALRIIEPILNLANVRRLLAKPIQVALTPLSYLYKDDAYSHEQEYRIVLTKSEINKNEIVFEDKSPKVAIRHFVERKELSIKKLFTTGSKIRLGPCVPHRDNIRYCIEELLRRADLEHTKVKFSKIPYRKL